MAKGIGARRLLTLRFHLDCKLNIDAICQRSETIRTGTEEFWLEAEWNEPKHSMRRILTLNFVCHSPHRWWVKAKLFFLNQDRHSVLELAEHEESAEPMQEEEMLDGRILLRLEFHPLSEELMQRLFQLLNTDNQLSVYVKFIAVRDDGNETVELERVDQMSFGSPEVPMAAADQRLYFKSMFDWCTQEGDSMHVLQPSDQSFVSRPTTHSSSKAQSAASSIGCHYRSIQSIPIDYTSFADTDCNESRGDNEVDEQEMMKKQLRDKYAVALSKPKLTSAQREELHLDYALELSSLASTVRRPRWQNKQTTEHVRHDYSYVPTPEMAKLLSRIDPPRFHRASSSVVEYAPTPRQPLRRITHGGHDEHNIHNCPSKRRLCQSQLDANTEDVTGILLINDDDDDNDDHDDGNGAFGTDLDESTPMEMYTRWLNRQNITSDKHFGMTLEHVCRISAWEVAKPDKVKKRKTTVALPPPLSQPPLSSSRRKSQNPQRCAPAADTAPLKEDIVQLDKCLLENEMHKELSNPRMIGNKVKKRNVVGIHRSNKTMLKSPKEVAKVEKGEENEKHK